MAEPNEIAEGGKDAAPATKSELPHVESPSISPAEQRLTELASIMATDPVKPAPFAAAPETKPQAKAEPAPEWKKKLLGLPQIKLPGVTISRRLRRTANLAATVMIAAGLGAAVGAALDKRQQPVQVAQRDTALIEENQAMQKSLARLSRELSTLKASIDSTKNSIEAASKDNRSQIAKLTDRLEKTPASDITASISKPATMATPPEPTPLPTARPQVAEPRLPVVPGWTIHEIKNGMAWVEYRGDLYRAAPGIPLPGLGHVEAIRRDNNQWVVVTQRGLITNGEATARAERPRPYYPPYYRP